jgi:hypothetical protein
MNVATLSYYCSPKIFVMRIFLLIILLAILGLHVNGQSDTTITYYSKDRKKCDRDSAHHINRSYYDGKHWVTLSTWASTGNVHFITRYADKERRKPVDSTTYFRENGSPHKTFFWENSRPAKGLYFYENGKKSGEVIYSSGEPIYRGWDTSGTLMEGYIVEKEPNFPGGAAAWQQFLEQNLRPKVAARAGSRAGEYTVRVGFTVNTDGSVSNVHPLDATPGCNACIKEAVRVVTKAPRWNPAIVDNQPADFQAVQHITFQVIER